MHPGYQTRRWAEDHALGSTAPPVAFVQHHHAHIASVMAEHGVPDGERVIGCAFDGTGYGTDGAIWGGEVLVASYDAFERPHHLRYVPLPGGDAAIRKPYRAALAHLWAAGIEWAPDLAPVRVAPPPERAVLQRQLERGVQCIPTLQHGPAVRRRQLAARPAPQRVLRGPGRHRARDRRGRRRGGIRVPVPERRTGDRRCPRAPGARRRPPCRPPRGRGRSQVPPGGGAPDRRRRRPPPGADGDRSGRAQRRRVPERAAGAARPARSSQRGASASSAIGSSRPTTVASRSARSPSPAGRPVRSRRPAEEPRARERPGSTFPRRRPGGRGVVAGPTLRRRRHDVVRVAALARPRAPRGGRVRAPGHRRQAGAARRRPRR